MNDQAVRAIRVKRFNKVRSPLRTVRPGALLGAVGLPLLLLSGCVSTGKYQALEAERNSLLEQQVQLHSQVAETEAQKAAAAHRAQQAQAELARQQEVYDNLQATFAKERSANQIKIERIQSGIKVNLANAILFPSGSAELNDQGVEVLTRAASELKKSPYQTLVAGFTDNVAIHGALQTKYPTNWELAAARAASVVRLLEREGVPADKLLALSFGEQNPVAPNDSEDGRSRNRRIEIIQRPVPVSTN